MRTFILGTDWGTDCDDVVAVRLLTRAVKAQKIKLAAIGINHCFDNSVASLDGFLTMEGISGVQIGLDRNITEGEGRYQKHLSQYASCYRSNDDAEDAVRVYRKVLAESKEPVEILEIGFLHVIAKVLESGPDDISNLSGVELLRQKAAKLWVMAGKWDQNGGKEYNIVYNNITRRAAHILCEKCPVPITFLGWEIGHDVITGNLLKKDDLLYRAMCDHGSSNGRYSWDPMLVQLALVGNEAEAGYRIVQGRASVDAESGCNYFEASQDGLHGYVVRLQETQYYADQINEIIG